MTDSSALQCLLDTDPGAAEERLQGMFDAAAGERSASFVLFGAGVLGRRTLVGLRKIGVAPLAFADNNPRLWGTQVNGLEVMSAADAAQRFGPDVPFVVTIYTGAQVRRQLRQSGLKAIPFAALYYKYARQFIPFCCLDHPRNLLEEKEDVGRALPLWADAESRREYVDQVRYRLTQADDLSAGMPPGDMHFPEGLIRPEASERFVDCGAFDGDTLKAFLDKRGDAFERADALEPDPANHARLAEFIAALPAQTRSRVHAHAVAAGSRRGVIRFDATGTVESSTSVGAGVEVRVVPLDELFADVPAPTYIKMDIEGAELDALVGAQQIIRRHLPVLSVCLYHRQSDLWRIPLFIASLTDRYRLFLRRYSDDCWEQVCYAVPPDRLA